ncbi:Hpt domain-containing protein, partial [Nodosilinea sp. AN01ver1]|uniref:Hpt domain-containing protein n=1 Tax=Nodosilinea sp. AN01ver1 TaxID=3423362 RepID=UPI003D31599B
MMIDDIELRDIFKTSSAERLQALDDGLLHLEKHPDDPEILASLMREAHSLKGDGNMLGVTDLGKVAHQFEHVLGAIKRGEQTLSSDLFDRLARGLTAMRQIVHEAATGEPAQVKVFYVMAELMGAELAPPAAEADNALVPADEAPQSAACDAADATDDIASSIFAELPQSVVADLEGDLSAANGKEATNGAIALEQAKRSDRYIDDDELRSLFKSTSEEHLQALDDGLLHLEKHPDDQDVLEALLRDAHSLKGDSTMLGVGDLGKIAHQIEHLLGLVKRNEAPLSADLCDRLAHGMAAMKQLVHEATTGEPTNVNVFYVLAELMGASP